MRILKIISLLLIFLGSITLSIAQTEKDSKVPSKAFAMKRLPGKVASISNNKIVMVDGNDYSIKSRSFNYTFIVIRHVEKIDMSEESSISELGVARSEKLAKILEEFPVDAIYTTKLKRSEQSTIPLAKAKELKPFTYDLKDYDEIIRTVKENDQHFIVVIAHSTTANGFVNYLAGTHLPALNEAEYSKMFIVKTNLLKGKVFSVKY